MERDTTSNALSPVLITLYKGVLYQEQKPELWQALLELTPRVQDHAALLGLELLVDEAEGYAYLKQREPAEDELELPRLVQRRQLGYAVSLLLALLRKKLAEHDAAGGEARLILSREKIVDLMRVFVSESSNEAKLMDRINTDINKVVELGFLRPLRGQDNQFELLRIIKTFVDAQWLGEFTERLETYRSELKDD
ncbi:MAG: DUF4194 domain-containing protein [Pirellulales bacterium]|nr:DUF4194 domain-containing protein [Pirellulales bacterium]